MQSVGEKLREARLQKQVTLDEVYKRTKIHTRVLEALEQDRAHNFLSPLYIKGFLKAYAQYLGLDSEGLLKEYIDSQKVEDAPSQVTLKKKRKVLPQINPFLIFRITLIAVLSFAFIFYFRYVLKNIPAAGKKAQIQKVRVKVVPAPAVETEDLILQVRTKEECWMKVKLDGRVVFQKTLPKGRVEKWRAKERLELRIGKPEALDVRLNGKLIDLKKAQVKRTLVITHEGIQGK